MQETIGEAATADGELAAWCDDIRDRAIDRLTHRVAAAPRSLRIGALAAVLLAALAALLVVRLPSRPRPAADVAPVRVNWIEMLPEPPLPTPLFRATPSRSATVRKSGPPVLADQPPAPPPQQGIAALPRLFAPDGAILMPALPAPESPATAAEVMSRGHNLLHCRRTRFATAFKRDLSLGERIASNPVLKLLGLGNPYLEQQAADRLARDAAGCDG